MQFGKTESEMRKIMHSLVVVIWTIHEWLRTKLSYLGMLDKSLMELASQYTNMSMFSVTETREVVKNS